MNTVQIIRSRRKTLSLQITPGGAVILRCPLGMSDREALAFAAQKQHWIQAHLAALPPAEPALTPEALKRLAREASEDLSRRTETFARQMGLSYGRITIRAQRSRWGSCSGKGNLNFNCLLMLAPAEVRDYVVVHELCHLRQRNHAPAFWAEVAAVLPGYRCQAQWLKENGTGLLARLPGNFRNPG